MAAPTGSFYGVGLEFARIYALNEKGYPNATSTTVYEGLEIGAPKTFEVAAAKSRDVVATGNNRRLAQDKLPSLDVSGATLKTSRLDFAMNALLTGGKVVTVGESLFTGFNTDLQGTEPTLAMLLYQFGKIAGSGVRAYGAYHLPSTISIVDPASMNDNYGEFTYNVVQSAVNHYIHGPLFTIADEGFTEAEVLWSLTFGRPHIVAWLGDGVVTEFLFHADRPATAVGKIHCVTKVTAAGVVSDISGQGLATDGVTPTVKPDSGDLILAFYEY